MQVGECYTVKLANYFHKVGYLVRDGMKVNIEAIIRVDSEVRQWHKNKGPKKRNKRYNITVIRMIKGDMWPYDTMSVNNLKKCKGVFNNAATILFSTKGVDNGGV
jgi:hypothetical protein